LNALLNFGYPDHVFSSNYIADQDQEKCINCGSCIDSCQFKARSINDSGLHFEPDKCYGCGLCLNACPEKAIVMTQIDHK
jgi:heterodisulfide reductase subunit A-like polyferredoxin